MGGVTVNDVRDRAAAVILECFAEDWEPNPTEVAEVLVDQDVAAGQYQGCSAELEAWWNEYARAACDLLGVV